MQYSTTGDILDTIFIINSCNSLYRTARAVKVDALAIIFRIRPARRLRAGFRIFPGKKIMHRARGAAARV